MVLILIKARQSFQNFLREHATKPPSISVAISVLHMKVAISVLHMNVAIFFSKFLQNINQNTSIVFKNFTGRYISTPIIIFYIEICFV